MGINFIKVIGIDNEKKSIMFTLDELVEIWSGLDAVVRDTHRMMKAGVDRALICILCVLVTVLRIRFKEQSANYVMKRLNRTKFQ